MSYLEIGVISEGTLRCEDIIDSMLSALKGLDSPEAKAVVERYEHDLETIHEEHLAEMRSELEDEMFEFIPPYTYFGSIDGDGACIGVWPDIDMVQQEIREGELKDFQEADDTFVGTVANITDHGNVSLLKFNKGQTEEIWSVV